ncbi:hypothetical protein pb186bvf_015639 [Paramecium bursaria]
MFYIIFLFFVFCFQYSNLSLLGKNYINIYNDITIFTYTQCFIFYSDHIFTLMFYIIQLIMLQYSLTYRFLYYLDNYVTIFIRLTRKVQ